MKCLHVQCGCSFLKMNYFDFYVFLGSLYIYLGNIENQFLTKKTFHNYKVCKLLLLLQVVLHSFYWDTLYRGLGTEQRSFMGIQNILLPLFRVNKDMVWTLSLTILNHWYLPPTPRDAIASKNAESTLSLNMNHVSSKDPSIEIMDRGAFDVQIH